MTDNSTYYWRVRVGDSKGYGNWTARNTFQTLVLSPKLLSIQTGNKVDIVIASNHITEISGPKNLTKVIQKISINEMLKDFQNTVIKNARQNFNQK